SSRTFKPKPRAPESPSAYMWRATTRHSVSINGWASSPWKPTDPTFCSSGLPLRKNRLVLHGIAIGADSHDEDVQVAQGLLRQPVDALRQDGPEWPMKDQTERRSRRRRPMHLQWLAFREHKLQCAGRQLNLEAASQTRLKGFNF